MREQIKNSYQEQLSLPETVVCVTSFGRSLTRSADADMHGPVALKVEDEVRSTVIGCMALLDQPFMAARPNRYATIGSLHCCRLMNFRSGSRIRFLYPVPESCRMGHEVGSSASAHIQRVCNGGDSSKCARCGMSIDSVIS